MSRQYPLTPHRLLPFLVFCILHSAFCIPLLADLTPEQTQQAQALIAQFTSPEFAVRQQAVDQLIALGPDVLPLIQKTLAQTKDPEVKLRCEMVVKGITAKPKPVRKLEEKVVQALGPSYPLNAAYFVRSSDSKGFAYVLSEGDRTVVVHNGNRVGEYELAQINALSADGQRLAYVAQEGGKWFTVLDGEKLRYTVWGSLVFSSDSKHVAFGTKQGDKRFIVCDGKEGKGYDEIEGVRFSQDTQHVMYAAQRGKKWLAVVDGIEGAEHDWLALLETGNTTLKCRTLDGDEVALLEVDFPKGEEARPTRVAERRLKLIGKLPVNAGKADWKTDYQGSYLLVMSELQGKKVVFFNGTLLGTYDQVGGAIWRTSVSPDGRHVAYAARRADSEFIVIDGKEGPAQQKIAYCLFSPDSKRLAYCTARDSKEMVVCDEKQQDAYDHVENITFSADGQRLAYRARRGNESFIVCDGEELNAYAVLPGGGFCVEPPVFSPDGRHVAYIARRGSTQFVVCDGREGPEHSVAHGVRFSPDGTHLAYVAWRGKKMVTICDGVEGAEHDAVNFYTERGTPISETVRETGTLVYTIVDAGKENLVEVNWPKDLDWTNGLKPMDR